jgi:hypothetical protein
MQRSEKGMVMAHRYNLFRRKNYHSYLLRLWREGETTGWRASLQETGSEQHQQFANLELLVDYLYRQTSGRTENKSE